MSCVTNVLPKSFGRHDNPDMRCRAQGLCIKPRPLPSFFTPEFFSTSFVRNSRVTQASETNRAVPKNAEHAVKFGS
jgi:hypothetical protein